MPAQPVTPTEEIIKAADELEAAGQKINGNSLRKALGNVGRPDRLIGVYEAEKRRRRQATPPALPPEVIALRDAIGSELLARLASMSQDFWETAMMLAASQATAELQTFRAKIDELEAELVVAADNLDVADKKAVDLEQALETESGRLISAEERSEALMQQTHKLAAEAAEAAHFIPGLRGRIEESDRQLEHWRILTAAAQQEAQAATATAEAAVRAANEARLELDSVRSDAVRAKDRASSSTTQLNKELEVARSLISQLQADLVCANKETELARELTASSTRQTAWLQDRLLEFWQSSAPSKSDHSNKAPDDIPTAQYAA